ncbi:MAG: TOBE domain-containing protein [Beijerinckiaceae bacterium]|nr:TOBE domain-containing protein [Beijerinckiaceae bacterium]MCI0737289.1 TOBE domain-containing protein [Beijerinckiaceae bacterium]
MAHSSPAEIDCFLAWRSGGRLLIGRERIELLEAVAEHKSITKAAEIAGFSYKTAWDAVNAINSLLPRPAFITRTGGTHGGGAEITDEGRRLILAFRRLETKLGRISTAIAEQGLEHEQDLLFWGIGLKLSVRNALFGEVTKVTPGPVNVEVKLKASPGISITTIVTNDSVSELSLAPGRRCIAMVNASSIVLTQNGAAAHLSTRNKIRGTVVRRTDDGTDSEIAVDIGEGRTITAVVTSDGADEAGAVIGAQVLAAFKASQVILGAD